MCFALALASGQLAAKSPRGVSGFYGTHLVNAGPRTVKVAVTIRIINNTGAGLTGSVPRLRESLPPHKVIGSFISISLNAGEQKLLKGEFVLPSSEYARWQRGGRPELSLEIKDANGHLTSLPVELVRGSARLEE